MSIKIKFFCHVCEKGDQRRDKGLVIPSNVIAHRGISYGPDKKFHTLDVFRPANAVGELPVFVNIHGGGYVCGSTDSYQFYCADMALRGFAVVSFNYRLAPKWKFPAPVEDTNSVMIWICKNAEAYGFDLTKVAFVGDSAGAQIASQYATICSNQEYAKKFGFSPPHFRLGAIVLNCGAYDIFEDMDSDSKLNFLNDAYFTKDIAKWGDILDIPKFITPAFPPAYIMSAPGDFLFKKCESMAKLLQSKGIHTEYRIFGTEKTGHVFHLNIRSELAKQASQDEANFIHIQLG